MKLMNIVKATLRLLCSPVVGAIDGMKEAVNRPRATNWKQFILNDARAYFAPLTGAINGVKKELSRREKV